MKDEKKYEYEYYEENEKKICRRDFLSLIWSLMIGGSILLPFYSSILSKFPRKNDERWENNTLIYYFVKGGFDPELFKEFYQKYPDLVNYLDRKGKKELLIAPFELYKTDPFKFERIYKFVKEDHRIDPEYKPIIISRASQLCFRIGCEKENLTESSIKALIDLAIEYELSKSSK